MAIRPANSPLTPEFDALVQKQLTKWKVPGLTIAVVHGSQTYSKAYGISQFPDKQMTTDTLFSTCSTTKAFTAAALSLEIDDSKSTPSPISWDTPISSLIRDDFVLADEHATANTTIEDALSHRSGLASHDAAMAIAYPNETLRHEVRKLRYLPLAFAPRTTFDYCNHMYMALSHLLETRTGEELGSILKNRIWDKLGMKDTYFNVQKVKTCPKTAPRLAQGYTWVPETRTYAAEPHMNYLPTTGTGSMVSNVLDYARWLRSMINQSGPISPEGYAAILHPRSIIPDTYDLVAPPGPYHLYAFGWFVDQYQGERLYWHSGSWDGFGIMVGFIPSRKWGFAMMGNTTNARNAQLELYLYLIDQLLGVPGDERMEHIARFNAYVENMETTKAKDTDQAKKQLYPSLPDSPIPPTLRHHGYTGTYNHPGYGPLTVQLEDETLYVDLTDRVIQYRFELEHASGEFFVGKVFYPGRGGGAQRFYRVQFYVDATGTATRVGWEVEPSLREMIWFERV